MDGVLREERKKEKDGGEGEPDNSILSSAVSSETGGVGEPERERWVHSALELAEVALWPEKVDGSVQPGPIRRPAPDNASAAASDGPTAAVHQ